MNNYATINDVIALWRTLTADEISKAETLIPIVCDSLRYEAEKVGKDLDAMISENSVLASVAKSVVVDVVRRYMNDNSTDSVSMSQFSQAAGGYTVSGTFLSAGGGLFIKKSELAKLGLKRQRFGVIELWH